MGTAESQKLKTSSFESQTISLNEMMFLDESLQKESLNNLKKDHKTSNPQITI